MDKTIKTTDMKLLDFKILVLALLMASFEAAGQKASELRYYDVRELGLPVIGRGFADCIRENDTISDGYYTRLPASMQGNVRKAVWDLGQNSSGIAVRFRSDSRCIGAKWKLLNNFGMAHMAATGVKGLDLYALGDDNQWHFAGTAQPNGKVSCNIFIRKMDGNMREYLMYLPLYDGVTSLEIGIDSTATILQPENPSLIPPAAGNPAEGAILVYGTSVTQGGCASRPGMSFTSILERKLHRQTINLGFSGNGRMDGVIAEAIAGVPASVFVIDCLANCDYDIVRDSTEYFIRTIAEANPETPVLMLSNYCYPYHWLDAQFREDAARENALWKEFCDRLRKEGYKNIRYIDLYSECNMKKSAIGPDHEGTVDGVHMTDLGFLRYAQALLPYLEKVLK